MYCFTLRHGFLTAVLTAAALLWPRIGIADDWRPIGEDASTTKIRQALEQATTLEFIETPLLDVVDYLRELHGVEIQIDYSIADAAGIGSDTPVTKNLKGVSLESALRVMLRDLKLTFVVRDEVVLITTPAECEKLTVTQVYDVEPLINAEHKIDELAKAVTAALGRRHKMPPTDAKALVEGKEAKDEEDDAARGIAVYRNFLIVTDSDTGHRQVQRLLGLIGAGLQMRPENGIR